jgi:hypothetical protein
MTFPEIFTKAASQSANKNYPKEALKVTAPLAYTLEEARYELILNA